MGLLDYYRQFEGMSEDEVNARLRERAARERERALARVEPLDLSTTTPPELPHSEIVNAIAAAARTGALNRYGDRAGGRLRRSLAARHAVAEERIAIGHGAADLLAAAARALLEPGDELVTPWPSYPLYPLMARRAQGRAVPVDGFDPNAILAAVTPRTRVVALCNPNDPTGEHLSASALHALVTRLPERVWLLLDQALADYADAEDPDDALELPRTLAFRTFSKAWGLTGLRCGYVIGPPDAAELLDALAPPLGVGALSEAGALAALRREQVVERRVQTVIAERARLLDALAELPADAPASQANVVWLSAPGHSGEDLRARLEHLGVLVAAGGPLGDEDHVRAAIQSPAATDRLLRALEVALG
jgi:histidinol-phosphate aminotransferase